MWDCGPYADLYEEFDEEWGEYEWFEDHMRQPMEFAKNNMRAFTYDLESAAGRCGHLWCEFSNTQPMGGRFKFELLCRLFGNHPGETGTVSWLIWMPSARLSHLRKMPATTGPRKTVLLNGACQSWEEALTTIRISMWGSVS